MKIELRDIHKHYGAMKANNGISFTVRPGTIHGILGENGAGKSTLMKLLVGYIPKTSGTILVNEKVVDIASPARAARLGIGMLYQDPMDFRRLTVLENFMLKKKGPVFLSRKKVLQSFSEIAAYLGFQLNPDDLIQRLTVGERQQLELIRLLMMDVKVLILDEPTTGISDTQKVSLFQALEKLAEDGRSVILVSHKLEDVQRLCSSVTVLRHGRVNGSLDRPFDRDRLLAMMFDTPPQVSFREPLSPGRQILQMEAVSAAGGRTGLKNCSVRIHQHEIVGLAGLEGSGQGVFLRCGAGLIQPQKGWVTVDDCPMRGKDYHAFHQKGITFLPADRLEEGLMEGMTIQEHFALSIGRKRLLIPKKKALSVSRNQIRRFQIKGRPGSPVESLSGGNQQRLLLSMLPRKPRLLLLENPTRGLDIESAQWVWAKLQQLCRSKASIVFSSSDMDEILAVSDRILVFFNGRMVKMSRTSEISIEMLGRAVAGLADA